MIDVARHVFARAAVNRPFLVYTEEIFSVALLNLVVRQEWPEVFDDSLTFWYRTAPVQSWFSSVRMEHPVACGECSLTDWHARRACFTDFLRTGAQASRLQSL